MFLKSPLPSRPTFFAGRKRIIYLSRMKKRTRGVFVTFRTQPKLEGNFSPISWRHEATRNSSTGTLVLVIQLGHNFLGRVRFSAYLGRPFLNFIYPPRCIKEIEWPDTTTYSGRILYESGTPAEFKHFYERN